MIPYGSCLEKYSPCVSGYVTAGSTYEKYICKSSLKAIGVGYSTGNRLGVYSWSFVCWVILGIMLLSSFA